jgi:hypothetical protein
VSHASQPMVGERRLLHINTTLIHPIQYEWV